MPLRPQLPKGHVDGLAEKLGNDPTCRKRILDSGTLLVWPSPKTTGLATSKSLRLNVDLMIVVGSVLCPQSSTPLSLVVGPPKKEARIGSSPKLGFRPNIDPYTDPYYREPNGTLTWGKYKQSVAHPDGLDNYLPPQVSQNSLSNNLAQPPQPQSYKLFHGSCR